MPDENSNLNLPAAARRPAARRRGRRGGRGRGPRTGAPKNLASGTENSSPAPDSLEPNAPPAEAMDHSEHEEHEPENKGGFRTPHAEEPSEFASHAAEPPEHSESEIAEEHLPVSEPERSVPPERLREQPLRPRQPERQPERRPEPQRPKPWVKPADFRPAETSAISQAVEHATHIAEALKSLLDELDEVLELVEVADRQKLADEREIDELRRALRRIQPPRQSPPPPQQQFSQRGPRRDEPREQREQREPRRDQRDQREQPPRSAEPPVQREPEPPRESAIPQE